MALSTGALLALTGANDANAARDRMEGAATVSAWDAAKADFDGGVTRTDVGYIFMGTGVAGLALSGILLATAPRFRATMSTQIATKGLRVGGNW